MSETVQTPIAPVTGLVLSGGGAKGAYQVGVLKALLELDADIDMVAGASMGALNGAVLACAPSLPEGVQRLEKLWNTLAAQSPVEANTPFYLKFLAAAGLTLGVPLPQILTTFLAKMPIPPLAKPFIQTACDNLTPAILSDEPLKALMDEYLDTKELMRGLPLYVSVYESRGGLDDLLSCMLAESGLQDTPPSKFLHVQSLPANQRREALLASAAIPLLYQARQIGVARYSDGGQGGWQKAQGNTPITPLIEAGCKQVIVTHLTDGALWSRHDFPDTAVLEIRPQTWITQESSPLGAIKAALGFDASSIARLMQQGYDDTLHCVGRVMKAAQSRQALLQSERSQEDSLLRGKAVDGALAEAMSRLN